jgi:hypothetical protein
MLPASSISLHIESVTYRGGDPYRFAGSPVRLAYPEWNQEKLEYPRDSSPLKSYVHSDIFTVGS